MSQAEKPHPHDRGEQAERAAEGAREDGRDQQGGVGDEAEDGDRDPGELGVLALLDRVASAADHADRIVPGRADRREVSRDAEAGHGDGADGDPEGALARSARAHDAGGPTAAIAALNPSSVLTCFSPRGPFTMKYGVWLTPSAVASLERWKYVVATALLW